jgi:hypothetical protein
VTGSELDRRRKRAALWIVTVCVVTVGVTFALTLVASSSGYTDRSARKLIGTVLGLGIGLALVAVVVLVHAGGRSRLRALVAEAHPDATVIPAYAESPGGLTGWVSVTIAVAVLTDHLEVWADGRAPLSTMPLADAEVRVQGVLVSTSRYPGIRVTSGTDSVSFVPAYSAAAGRPADLERALHELGEDLADHRSLLR